MSDSVSLPGVEIKNDQVHYGVCDLGAHAYAYQPDGHKPVLWLSQKSNFTAGTAIRGGIPIILPWFGTGPTGTRQPAHGFARLTEWNRTGLEDTVEFDGRLVVHYELSSQGDNKCPVSWIADYRIAYGPSALQVALTVINTGSAPFTFENALHTYLAVGDIKNVTVDGLDDTVYFDKAAQASVRNCLQSGPVTFTAETDRIYLSASRVIVNDPVWGRRLIIDKTGSSNTVVWNPWIDKAAAMADFGDDEWRGMLCIEAANVIDNAITLTPGASQVLTQKITVENR